MQALQFPNRTSAELPPWIPAEVAGVTSFSWDMQASFDPLVKLIGLAYDDSIGEKGAFQDTLNALANDPDGPKVNVRTDFVRWLGKRVLVLTGREKPGQVVADRSLFAFEITDEPAVTRALAKFMSNRPEGESDGIDNDNEVDEAIFHKRTIAGHAVYQFDSRTQHKAARKELAKAAPIDSVRKRRLVLTVAKGYLFWGSDAALLERLLTLDNSLARDPRFELVRGEVDRLAVGPTSFRSYALCGDDFRILARCIDPQDFYMPFFMEAEGSQRASGTREQRMTETSSASHNSPGPGGWYARSLDDGWSITGFVLKLHSSRNNESTPQ